jgi:signal peptidase II
VKKALATILAVLAVDQGIKLWIKSTFYYGDRKPLIENWLDLQFVENPGMAFGWMIPGDAGKLILSIFRILVVIGIGYYLWKIIKQKAHWGYIISVSLIVAGALGNIIDSAVYGLLFNIGSKYNAEINDYVAYHDLAQMNGAGYAPFLMGNVVDMFHFTKVVHFPNWFPVWGGQTRELFPPVFNIADSAITMGIIVILLFQKRFFPQKETIATAQPAESPAASDFQEIPETPSENPAEQSA